MGSKTLHDGFTLYACIDRVRCRALPRGALGIPLGDGTVHRTRRLHSREEKHDRGRRELSVTSSLRARTANGEHMDLRSRTHGSHSGDAQLAVAINIQDEAPRRKPSGLAEKLVANTTDNL